MSLEGLSLNRYPDPKQMEVKALLAEMRGVRPEQIFVGVGSDEAIDLLIRIFCSPGNDTIIVTPPTYGMYKVTFAVGAVGLCTHGGVWLLVFVQALVVSQDPLFRLCCA